MAGAGTNLVTNPIVANDATNWAFNGVGTTVTWITTDAYIGSACVEVVVSNVAGAGVKINSTDRMPVVATTTYTFSVSAKLIGESAYNFRMAVFWYNGAGVNISNSQSGVLTMTADWTWLDWTATAPAGAVSAFVILQRSSSGVHTYRVGAAQFGAGTYMTPLAVGSFNGHSWASGAPASASTRPDCTPSQP